MTSEIYKLIISIKDMLHDFDDKKPNEIAKLYKMQYLEHYHYSKDGKSIFAWRLTDKAIKEMEEYEKSLRQEDREIKSLQIADKVNHISKWSLVVSIISAVIAVIAIIVSAI